MATAAGTPMKPAKTKTAMTPDERRLRYKRLLAAAVEDPDMDAMLWKMNEDPNALRESFRKMTSGSDKPKCGCHYRYRSVILVENLVKRDHQQCSCCGPLNQVTVSDVSVKRADENDDDSDIVAADLVTYKIEWKTGNSKWDYDHEETKREPWDIVRAIDTHGDHILHIVDAFNIRDFLRLS